MKIDALSLFSEVSKISFLATPAFLLLAMAMVMLPIPSVLLDILFTFNITFSLLMLLLAINLDKPLNFSSFPSLLLVTTLLRLSLNVASTRIVLLQGHTGSAAAGHVIEAFGAVAIGGNYLVGFVIFIILIIVNFVVITKGCTRISEVNARFTLDAMPGKQMAIDADLNAGIIDQQQAKERREEISQEADFYGSMDGATKFVRGDAVASLLILAINLIGGILIGILQQDMDAADALKVYALLTIGDGLVAQIPSLLLSTTAAIMVSRVANAGNIPSQIRREVFSSPKLIIITAGILVTIGLAPSMPHVPFIGFGILLASLGMLSLKNESLQQDKKDSISQTKTDSEEPLSWQDIPQIDPISLEIGYRLIPLVESSTGIDLAGSIKGIRRSISQKYGFLVPSIHIRDNLALDPDCYEIKLNGVPLERYKIAYRCILAIKTESTTGSIVGQPAKDPAYGLESVWVKHDQSEDAVRQGYTVIEAPMVIATHIGRIIEEQASELFGYNEGQNWLENLRDVSPRLADDLVPDKLSLSQLVKVCQLLLSEKVPISNVKTIASKLIEVCDQTKKKDPILLCQDVRSSLKRVIVNNLLGIDKMINTYTLSNDLERLMLQAWKQVSQNESFSPDAIPLDPKITSQLQQKLPEISEQMQKNDMVPLLLVNPQLRPMLGRFARLCCDNLTVLAFNEIPDDRKIKVVGQLG